MASIPQSTIFDCLGFSLNEQVAGKKQTGSQSTEYIIGKSEYLNCRHANSLSIEAKSDHFDGF